MIFTSIPVKASDEYYTDIVNNRITEESIESICENVGKRYGILPELLQSIAWKESNYMVNAENKGAKGLCQIVTKWHTDRINKLGITDVYDPYSNILLCADIISELRNHKYGEDVSFTLMAYNMGLDKAEQIYESCNISNYANSILGKSYELECVEE